MCGVGQVIMNRNRRSTPEDEPGPARGVSGHLPTPRGERPGAPPPPPWPLPPCHRNPALTGPGKLHPDEYRNQGPTRSVGDGECDGPVQHVGDVELDEAGMIIGRGRPRRAGIDPKSRAPR
jgi:hypothetical protein